jgi:hypothetical protein
MGTLVESVEKTREKNIYILKETYILEWEFDNITIETYCPDNVTLNETFWMPSVTVNGLSASRYEPRGVVLLRVPAGEVGDLAAGNHAERDERGRVVPPVVEDTAAAAHAAHDRSPDQAAEFRIAHRPMRAERDEIVF